MESLSKLEQEKQESIVNNRVSIIDESDESMLLKSNSEQKFVSFKDYFNFKSVFERIKGVSNSNS